MVRLILAIALAFPGISHSMIEIGGVSVTPPFFSPNGDGIQDFTTLTFSVATDNETALVWIGVVDSGGIPIRLLADGEKHTSGSVTKIWNGRTTSGSTAPEGRYSFEILAMSDSQTAGPVSAGVVLDNTSPAFDALIWPNPYAPDVESSDSLVTIELTPLDADEHDEILIWIVFDDQVDTLCQTQILDVHAVVTCKWDGRQKDDGLYDLWIKAFDKAGNSTQSSYIVDLDISGPSIEFIYPKASILTSFPDSVGGFAFDRNGLDSLGLRFTSDGDFTIPAVTVVRDTFYWQLPWPDSLLTEGDFDLECVASDSLGHFLHATFTLTIDTTPPARPTLAALPGEVNSPELEISGTSSPLDSVFIYVNGVSQIGVECSAVGSFAAKVNLELGENSIYAIAEDIAGHTSAPSETSLVTYTEPIGIRVPEHLERDSRIEINLTKQPSAISMDVYSLDGEHIVTVTWPKAEQYGEYEWNLEDDSGKPVRNGIYLLIFKITFEDGDTRIEKKAVAIAR